MQTGGTTIQARMGTSASDRYDGPPSSRARLPLPAPRRPQNVGRAHIMSEAELERAERSWGSEQWPNDLERDERSWRIER